MQALEPIGTALYKHLFFHFSNIHSTKKQTDFSYNKDYADICTIWLGGLKVLRFRSKILNEQLGRHLEALKQIELISDYTIEKNAKGDGFTLMFYPGGGFFQDYENFYEKQFQKSLPLRQVTDEQQHNEPLSIVHYFYSKLFPEQTAAQAIYLDKETDLARSLLGAYSMPEIQDLIDYTLDEASQSQFPIKTFGGVRAFVKPWLAERNTRASEQARAAVQVQAAREALLQSRYLDFRNKVLERSKANMTPEELKALEASIREQTKNYPGPAYAVEMTVRIKLDTAIANRFNVPSFEEWKAEMVA
jgi:hypothetical protein